MGKGKKLKDVTPLLTHWSYVFLARTITHQCDIYGVCVCVFQMAQQVFESVMSNSLVIEPMPEKNPFPRSDTNWKLLYEIFILLT